MIRSTLYLFVLCLLGSCVPHQDQAPSEVSEAPAIFLSVLGIAQDAGFPQAACRKDCCKAVWVRKVDRRMVSCLGLVDKTTNQSWLFDATPDFRDQLQVLEGHAPLTGIFLTHAHIGHYTGLIHLGREVMGANAVPVFAMPRMKQFLEENGPWSQLVALNNIRLQALASDSTLQLTSKITIVPLQVPHRDEFSETVGYLINGPSKTALFIPDIDKWQLWDRDIIKLIRKVDYAFLDGSFYQNGEIPGRDMSEIPHPFIEESMNLFAPLPEGERAKIYFIHFNHTNPVLQSGSSARAKLEAGGYHIAHEGLQVAL